MIGCSRILINDTRRDPRYGYESIQIGLPRIGEAGETGSTTVEGTLAPFKRALHCFTAGRGLLTANG